MAVVEAKTQNRRALTVWFTATAHGKVSGLRSQVVMRFCRLENGRWGQAPWAG